MYDVRTEEWGDPKICGQTVCTETGLEAIESLRFLNSFPLPGTGKREGGRQENATFQSLRFPPRYILQTGQGQKIKNIRESSFREAPLIV